MKRIVYKPRAYLFVKPSSLSDEKGDIPVIDLSDDVVSGGVVRKLGEISTLEMVLQNQNMKYTSNSGIRLTPMDPVTLWLQRAEGYPVRVFTGYLDSTPYYQLLPGTVNLTGSCTLKRLLYRYFDPSLDYTQAFLHKYNWQITPDGTIFNIDAQDGGGGGGLLGSPSEAANKAFKDGTSISGKDLKYKLGGGHAGFKGNKTYDCSGYVSHILHAAGALKSPLDSGALANWGKPGRGKYLTVYANASHVYIVFEKKVNGKWPRADTSAQGVGDPGPHMRYDDSPHRRSGFKERHYPGM